jgi:GDP-L-fucose synthase
MPVLEFFTEHDSRHRSYNVTPNSSISLLEIAEIVKKISQKNLEIKVTEPGFGLEYSGDNSRLKSETNCKFKKIEEAVNDLYCWYRDNLNSINQQLLLTDK